MKTAIIISGNLRTFLMPIRENPNYRLCDLFIRDILNNNKDADIFVYTDTSDFYYEGTQYYSGSRKIEILNNNSFRINNKIDFIENNAARQIIESQLTKIFGSQLKSLVIEDPFEASQDPKFNFLSQANVKGSSPTLLVHQFRKLKLAYQLMKDYESHLKYDIIVKWRFDISTHGNINFENYDYHNTDVYVAGIHSPIIYDWHAFGNRKGMDICLSLYDKLGTFLSEGQVFLCDTCRKYNFTLCLDHETSSEITLAPEYHLFRAFKEQNIKLRNSGYPACPYRYQDINTQDRVEDIVRNLNIDASVVSYTSGNETTTQKYEKK